ncbi:MAG TPA: hypothetical protein H9903_10305 [Candidatus Aquabacterium excrementipullorum]|nr:hypothetical protein [Candidatus Aquabacterium excrementipullorum]
MPRIFTRARRVFSAGLRLTLLAPMMSGTAAQAGAPTLCQADEPIWFSCAVGPTRIVSLCGTHDALQYRFGTPQRVELRYPASANTSPRAFRWAHHSRFQADRTEVSFHNQGVDYTLFDYTEAGRREAGVDVAPGRRLPCTQTPQGRLDQLKGKLPCDEDSALNLGHCPNTAE